MTRMQRERQRQGLSQTDLAMLAETYQPTISLIERGMLRPQQALAERIGAALEVAPELLLVEVGE